MKIQALRCDRCDRLYIPEKAGGWSIHSEEVDRIERTDTKFDLCPACESALKAWFEAVHEAA